MPYAEGRLPRRVREVFTEIMEIVGVWVRKSGEWAIIHRCKRCGIFHSNRVAADDDPLILMSVAVKPLASPPFPLSSLEKRGEKEETDT